MSLNEDHCGECDQDPCVCVVQDKKHITWAAKRPLTQSQYYEESNSDVQGEIEFFEENEEILEHRAKDVKRFRDALVCDEEYPRVPDLDVYFAEFHLSAQQRIAMCRTYANYLTQKLRSSGQLGPAKKNYGKTKRPPF